MLHNITFQVNLFGDFKDIEPKPEIMMELMPLWSKFSLMPSTFHEINPNFGMTPLNRLSFISQSNDFRIDIGIDKVTVSINTINSNGIETNIDKFAEDASYILEQILSKYNKLGTRVSLVTESLFPEYDSETLEHVYKKMFTPISFYNENKSFEWNARSVARINYDLSNKLEVINVITEVARLQGRFNNQITDFDRINLKFDINTIGQNSEKRLDGEAIKKFLFHAMETRNKLINEVESMIID